ncbi:MAG: hypothetical protein J2P19_32790 [Pseudonocardia sp.]|nr:hypothetical protein [Pseudonocardia sp.]
MSDPEVPGPPAGDGRVLDTPGAQGVLVGDFGFEVNFFEGTWTDPVASPPLADENGTVDSPYRGLRVRASADGAGLARQAVRGGQPAVHAGRDRPPAARRRPRPALLSRRVERV